MRAKPYENPETGERGITVFCPGCRIPHTCVQHVFDGDFAAPTIVPSLRQEFGNGGLCHSEVTAGRIKFLPDTTRHNLRGWHDLPELKGA